ncbi:MAG: hypothetical protein PHO41_03240 [Eubacteriales bacterium]|nr:hypothetical protein [Eubacteriales bacterium]
MKKFRYTLYTAALPLVIAAPAYALRVDGQFTDPDGNRLIMLGGALLVLGMWRMWRNDRKNRRK